MRMVFYLAMLAAFPALSTDMYLPALPALQQLWGVHESQTSLTLSLFFASFSFCLLVYGPISDRVGRRPVLLVGILIFMAGSLLCATAPSIEWLMAARTIQAAGAASASTLCMAVCRDLYEGDDRKKILSTLVVILAVFPMLAPSLGAVFLEFSSWRSIFLAQTTLALIGLVGTIRLKETLKERTTGGVWSVLSRYKYVLGNRGFIFLTSAFAIMGLPYFAFIGGSSTMFITLFGVSEQTYGLLFGFNALGLMTGSFFCSKMGHRFSTSGLMNGALMGLLGAAVILLLAGGGSVWAISLPMFLFSFFMGICRPLSTHIILDQVSTDVGAASSILTFSIFMFGTAGIQGIFASPEQIPVVLGWLATAGAFIPLLAYQFFLRRKAALA